ncbi:MAG: DUF4395 family protein [Actinomycetota bacterium]|nr:DUF4395 family protein [Actinomycetota bacterium]
MATRTAHPYEDTAVIDSRAPRFNQVVVGVVTLAAAITGWWPLVAIMAAQLIVGLLFGRRYCLPCVIYFEVIQPRFGEGSIEDSRPPRFANIVGAAFLGASTVAFLTGFASAGRVLAGIVSVLALFAATTGICVGCEIYRIAARLRGIRPGHVDRLDLSELGAPANGSGLVVQFTHPLCTDCHEVERRLTAEGHRLVLVDVSRRPDLAHKYQIAVVPTAVAVGGDGSVVQRLA